jgi:hypothetical protein
MILPQDSLYSNEILEVDRQQIEKGNDFRKTYALDSTNKRQLIGLTLFARTNDNGKAEFKNLPDDKSFEVLPLQPGQQFGFSKGVQKLDDDVSFTFTRVPHTIKLLSTREFNNLKKEKSLIVRTPQEASKWYMIIVGAFFLSFLILHLLLTFRFTHADQFFNWIGNIVVPASFQPQTLHPRFRFIQDVCIQR